jgi:two-component system NtrC family sensor kinase
MGKPLRVLIIEDSDSDAALDIRELEKAGYQITHKLVSTAEEMKAVIHTQTLDLIISDHNLPQFDSLKALEILRESGLDIPFLVVSGTIGEETAVNIMKAGAQDYVMKGNLARLGTAVERELRDKEVRYERKKVEEKIRESEEKLRSIVENSSDQIFMLDKDCKLLSINKTAADIFRKSPQEMIGTSILVIFPEDTAVRLSNNIKNVFDTGKRILVEEKMLIQGREYYNSTSLNSVKDDKGSVIAVTGIVRDITESRQAEEALRQSEEKYRQLVNNLREGIWVIDQDSCTTFVNPSMAEMLGYTTGEMLGRQLFSFMDERGVKLATQLLARRKEGIKEQHDFEFMRKHGTRVYVSLETSPITDKDGNYIGAIAGVQNVTERRKMQEQLIMQDRLASIGQLVSGVAHEINNPLTGIIGFSELLLARALPEDIKADLKIINDEAKRTATIVKGLLTFARKQSPEKQVIGIQESIKTVLQLRAHEQSLNNIQVKTRFASDLPQIMGNGSQLQQVFFNIVINAEFFMLEAHGKGTLTITTERIGDFVRASFADDGPGISEENMVKLFSPFHTTKAVGKGTGLGLSICHGIIAEHGGRIWAENGLGEGVTFIIELPIYHRSA